MICAERSWSSFFTALFSSAMDVSFWVTPESSCEMVTSPLSKVGEQGESRCL